MTSEFDEHGPVWPLGGAEYLGTIGTPPSLEDLCRETVISANNGEIPSGLGAGIQYCEDRAIAVYRPGGPITAEKVDLSNLQAGTVVQLKAPSEARQNFYNLRADAPLYGCAGVFVLGLGLYFQLRERREERRKAHSVSRPPTTSPARPDPAPRQPVAAPVPAQTEILKAQLEAAKNKAESLVAEAELKGYREGRSEGALETQRTASETAMAIFEILNNMFSAARESRQTSIEAPKQPQGEAVEGEIRDL